MKKFAFIGAGSFVFTRNIVRDLLSFPAFYDAEFCLMDIDKDRLDAIEACCRRILEASGKPAKITTTLSRKEALLNADGVLSLYSTVISTSGGTILKYRKNTA